MNRTFGRLCGVAVMLLALVVLAGCGSSKKSSSTSSSNKKASQGGTLTMLTNGDVDDKLDPGYSYYQLDFIYTGATQRAVLGNKPEDTTKASPDFAASYPTASKDGKTVTVKPNKGVKCSP